MSARLFEYSQLNIRRQALRPTYRQPYTAAWNSLLNPMVISVCRRPCEWQVLWLLAASHILYEVKHLKCVAERVGIFRVAWRRTCVHTEKNPSQRPPSRILEISTWPGYLLATLEFRRGADELDKSQHRDPQSRNVMTTKAIL